MAKNKIITSQGNVQFINSKGKTINMHPMHCYAVYENDTVSFLFVYMKDYSGQAFFTSQFEDLEVNGETYDNIDDLKDAITYAFAKAGAQARTEIVDELPEDPFTNTIYLVAKQHGEGYDEYIWNDEAQKWELIGDTDIEFERYLQIVTFNEYSATTKEQIDYISGAVDTNTSDIITLSGALDTEIATREAADSVISGAVDNVSADLSNEVSRAISAETALGNRIDTVNGRVDAEQLARVQADTALSGAIDTEIADRTAADTALQNAIDAEASARTDADTALDNKIAAVSGAVDSEVARATSAETTLNTAINTEASARRNADDAILGKIDAVSGAVDTEISARTDADTALQNAIDAEAAARAEDVAALSGAVDAVDSKVDTLSGEVQTMGEEAVVDAAYVSSSTTIDFYNASGDVVAQVDATDFIKDGMIEDVRIENGYLIIDFNTASGIEDISIPLTDIFDPDNYYDKDAIDEIVSGLQNEDGRLDYKIDTKLAISDFEIYSGAVETALGNKFDASGITAYSTSQEVTAEIEAATIEKVDTTAFTAYSASVETALGNKADLSALTEDERVWGEALNDLNSRINTVSGDVADKVDTTTYNTYTANTQTAINAKANSADVYNKSQVYTKSEVDEAIAEIDLSEYYTSAQTDSKIAEAVSGKVDTTDFETYSGAVESRIVEDEEVTAAGINAVNDKFGGLKLMKITQAAYDALTVKDNNTLYIISD